MTKCELWLMRSSRCSWNEALAVADLEGVRAGSAPPPSLGDRLTPLLTVILANAKF